MIYLGKNAIMEEFNLDRLERSWEILSLKHIVLSFKILVYRHTVKTLDSFRFSVR